MAFGEIIKIRKEFIQMRNNINKLDKSLAYIMVMKTAIIIYTVMINIYILSFLEKVERGEEIIKFMTFSTISSIIETIVTCFICGSVYEKSDEIYAILDEFNANDLTDNEFKEWLMFNTISRKTSFGFTIGGFASLRKTTLIPVRQNNHD